MVKMAANIEGSIYIINLLCAFACFFQTDEGKKCFSSEILCLSVLRENI